MKALGGKRLKQADAQALLMLVLGRLPTGPADTAPLLKQPPRAALRALVNRPLYRHEVLPHLMSGRHVPHLGLPRETFRTVRRRAAHLLAARHRRTTRRRLAFAESWPDLLRAAYETRPLRRAFLDRFTALDGPQGAAERLEQVVAALGRLARTRKPGLVAEIEAVQGHHVRGWAVDENRPDQPVSLLFMLNGVLAGTVRADGFRRDIQDRFGGSGTFGFEQDVSLPPALMSARSLTLSVLEATTGLPVCPPVTLYGDMAAPLAHTQRLVHRLERLGATLAARTDGKTAPLAQEIRDTLNRLEKRLPRASQFAAFPLENFDLFAACHGPGTPPEEPGPPKADSPAILLVGPPTETDAARARLTDQTRPPGTVIPVPDGPGLAERAGQALADQPQDAPIMLLRAGDRLAAPACDWMARMVARVPDSGEALITADHDRLASVGEDHADPGFKPLWPDRDMLMARDPYGPALAFTPALLARISGTDAVESAAGLAFALMLAAPDGHWHHCPERLWHFTGPPRAPHAERAALLNAHFKDGGRAVSITPWDCPLSGPVDDALDVRPAAPDGHTLSIIIPTRNGLDLLAPCLDSLWATASGTVALDVIIMDNGSDDPATLDWLQKAEQDGRARIIRDDRPFNWSALNNAGAEAAHGDMLLFLNNDTVALSRDWDRQVVAQLSRQNVGAVGARLLYEDGSLQHAGLVLYPTGVAAHEGAGDRVEDGLYRQRTRLPHATAAVTGAFLACRKGDFQALGGFDADHLAVSFNDVDFCLRLTERGLVAIYDPRITFNHLESKSRGYDFQASDKAARAAGERTWMEQHWHHRLAMDPYYPPVFVRRGQPFALMAPPTRARMAQAIDTAAPSAQKAGNEGVNRAGGDGA
ncbi:glycosyltransferase [Yunchengibacter salinarum]|uniref:glycosyltransferase n=1 Tax=Yunchengibacter salinarum TaxID=3133399 RepID=UPI0035B69AE6